MSPVITRLPILILYPHSRCNCRCVMCDIWKASDTAEISVRELQQHAADIVTLGVRWVVFSGGEPLMHSDFFRLCAVLKPLGVRLTILSTGLLLATNASRIVEHVDEVIVSLDGPREVHDHIRRVTGAFAQMERGIGDLHRLRPDFAVAGRCTVQKQNHTNLRATVDAARELGLQSISFLAADLTSTAFNRPEGWPDEKRAEVGLDVSEVAALEGEIEALIESTAANFVRETPEKLRRIARHFRAHLGFEPAVAPACNAPWVSAVLESDGTVRPCFFHEPIGSVRDGSLLDALNSPKAQAFRRNLSVAENPICQRCVCSLHVVT